MTPLALLITMYQGENNALMTRKGYETPGAAYA